MICNNGQRPFGGDGNSADGQLEYAQGDFEPMFTHPIDDAEPVVIDDGDAPCKFFGIRTTKRNRIRYSGNLAVVVVLTGLATTVGVAGIVTYAVLRYLENLLFG